MLNLISQYIPRAERILTIEDSAELVLNHPHVVRLETRPANTEGKGRITARELVVNSLRMRPDRIVLGRPGQKRRAIGMLWVLYPLSKPLRRGLRLARSSFKGAFENRVRPLWVRPLWPLWGATSIATPNVAERIATLRDLERELAAGKLKAEQVNP